MLYAETLRHFVQEWIEIQPPRDDRPWPWKDSTSRLYLINLYSISGAEPQHKMPAPFLSILINDIDRFNCFNGTCDTLYREFFEEDLFTLPRRYHYNPFVRGEKNFKVNRFTFTSDAYGENASDWRCADMKLIELLGSRDHCRYNTLVGCDETQALLQRLDDLANKAEVDGVQCAEDLLDFTDCITQYSPLMMLIQCPLTKDGILKPIKKSKKYRIINGTFIVCQDPVRLSIREEPSCDEYTKARIPFSDIAKTNGHISAGDSESARAIAYIAVEVPDGLFSFQEFTPAHHIVTRGQCDYARMLNHIFVIQPENVFNAIQVRLCHKIEEGLLPNVPENQRFFRKRTHEKLFDRTNLPDEYRKDKNGNLFVKMKTPE